MVSFGKRGGTALETEPLAPEGVPVAAPVPAVAPSAAFPRVNLIPEQVAVEARTQMAKRVCIAAVAGSAVVVAGLFVVANSQVSSAQDQLDAATAQSAALAAEATKYADVPRVNAQLAAATQQQATAMGAEVRWSSVLYSLAIATPNGVSLDSFTAIVNAAAPGAAAATPTSTGQSSTSILGNPGIGTMTFTGTATDQPHVATFLDKLTNASGVIDPFASTVAAASSSETNLKDKTVSFSSTATITSDALSHRYDGKGH
jgi:Tfp pilus assembly protein PilN